jgi:thiamine monophosphate kinase
MKSNRFLLAVSLVTALAALPAAAHHSFAAVYQADETMRIEGKVTQFLFRNPHSVLHVVVDGDNGEGTRWAVEWQGATQLGARGMSAQTLRPGDPVVVTGRPGRIDAEHRLLLVTIKRTTDGFGWGTRPDEVVD